MSISYLILDQQQERKPLNDHGGNWSERHLNVKINQQLTNLKETNSYWTPIQQKITNTIFYKQPQFMSSAWSCLAVLIIPGSKLFGKLFFCI